MHIKTFLEKYREKYLGLIKKRRREIIYLCKELHTIQIKGIISTIETTFDKYDNKDSIFETV